MAFLSQYRKLRGESNRGNNLGMREVEFNFGRTFHQLGLYSHAVKHYERVLELAETSGVSRILHCSDFVENPALGQPVRM